MSVDRVRAERGVWPEHAGYEVVLTGGGVVGVGAYNLLWFKEEAAADAFIEQVNTEPLPDGMYRSPLDGCLYVPNHLYPDDPPDGWRWRARAGSAAHAVEPAPLTERVRFHQIGRRTIAGHNAPIADIHWDGSAWVGNDTDGRVYPLSIDEPGTVEVNAEASR